MMIPENIAPASQALIFTERATLTASPRCWTWIPPRSPTVALCQSAGISFCSQARQSARPCGLTGLGLNMPDLGLPRMLLGGREVQYLDTIPIGSGVKRDSFLANRDGGGWRLTADDDRGTTAAELTASIQ